jgi:hypothetical protein
VRPGKTAAQEERSEFLHDKVVTKELRARALHLARHMPAETVEERERKAHAFAFIKHRSRRTSELEAFCERMEKIND